MKLSEWARRQGITYQTAHRWLHQGILPVKAEQLATGTILVYEEEPAGRRGVALYGRVSSQSDQREGLDRQIARLDELATRKGMRVTKTVTEIGSGLNGRRSKLLRLLSDPGIGMIVVEHEERLARFGAKHIKAALEGSGRKLVVADEGELEDDLVQEMIDVLTSFCARLYGRRSAKQRAKRALQAMGRGHADPPGVPLRAEAERRPKGAVRKARRRRQVRLELGAGRAHRPL